MELAKRNDSPIPICKLRKKCDISIKSLFKKLFLESIDRLYGQQSIRSPGKGESPAWKIKLP